MKFISTLGILFLFAIIQLTAQNPTSHPHIHVDQFGYLPSAEKVAVISDPQNGFNSNLSYTPSANLEVRDANSNQTIMTLSPVMWNNGDTHAQSGDKGWWLDFSDLTTPGEYYIFDSNQNEASPTFIVNDNVYGDVMKAAGRMYFYNRCGAAKPATYAESQWSDNISFQQDANCRYVYEPNNAALEKEMTGGWFDAGDFNKYVTFTHTVLHNLLSAYEENPEAFGDNWNIPESGNGTADIIDEIKWELDWLMKMNNTDGSTHIKMGSTNYDMNTQIPPSVNNDPRYYGPTCTSASITVAGIFAHAAKVFSGIDPTYASELETRAITSFDYFKNALDNNQIETNCDDGSIVSGDADVDYSAQIEVGVTAAVYLFELTGNAAYNQFIIEYHDDTEPISTDFWSGYLIPLYDALFLYADMPNANASVASTITSSISIRANNNWDGFFGLGGIDLYRSFMPDWAYHWGSNQPKAGFGILNMQLYNNDINPGVANSYLQKAAEQVHYFHGVNPLGLVHLSNMYSLGGDHCVNEIYHNWFSDGTDWDNALTSQFGPPPGYMTGGANASFSVGNISPPSGQPQQKSYLDFNADWPDSSWEISEPAIYYQAFYIRLLANFVTSSTTSAPSIINPEPEFSVYPNPVRSELNIIDIDNMQQQMEIMDMSGKTIRMMNQVELQLNVDNLDAGMYYIKIGNGIRKFIKI